MYSGICKEGTRYLDGGAWRWAPCYLHRDARFKPVQCNQISLSSVSEKSTDFSNMKKKSNLAWCSQLFSMSHQEDPTCPICVQWLRVKSLQRLIEDHSSSTVLCSGRYGNIIQERHLLDLIRYLSWCHHRIYTCWGGRCKLLSQWQDVGNHITGVFTWFCLLLLEDPFFFFQGPHVHERA